MTPKLWQIGSAVVLALWLASGAYCYSRGVHHERSADRAERLRQDQQLADSVEQLRKVRGAAASSALLAAHRLDSALALLKQHVVDSRRVVRVIDTTHVRIADTVAGTARDVVVPLEIAKQLHDDRGTIDSLFDANALQSLALDKLSLALSADSVTIRAERKLSADLRIEVPTPPLLDRIIARATVPVVKTALVAGIGYGAYRIVRDVLLPALRH